MAKQRVVNTKFWDDGYISELGPLEKLIFLYVLTNPLTDLCGAYEITLKRITNDTGVKASKVLSILEKFEIAGKVIYRNGWMIVRNFTKHQVSNPKVAKGIERSLSDCPDWIKDSLSKPMIDHRTLTLTSRENLNLKGQPIPEPFGDFSNEKSLSNETPDREPVLKPKSEADEVFEFWQEALNHPDCKFTKERKTKVHARLKTYSVEQIKKAILGCQMSPHHQGDNDRHTKYDDLELICRNDTQLEKFIGYATAKPKTQQNGCRDDYSLQKQIEEQNGPREKQWAN